MREIGPDDAVGVVLSFEQVPTVGLYALGIRVSRSDEGREQHIGGAWRQQMPVPSVDHRLAAAGHVGGHDHLAQLQPFDQRARCALAVIGWEFLCDFTL